ncbi:MAG: DUF3459 domain-containing protein, partial [Microbacterium sp.]|nr:DUF3459 domain-containing protein [Microbacterium sp.]
RPELTDPSFGDLSAEVVDADAAPDSRRFVLHRGPLRVIVNLSDAAWTVPVKGGDVLLLSTRSRTADGDSSEDDARVSDSPAAPGAGANHTSARGQLIVPPDVAVILGPAV